MTTAAMPPDDDQELDLDDDTLPPEHPAGADPTVSAGEVLSGEGVGTAGAAATTPPDAGVGSDNVPGDDS